MNPTVHPVYLLRAYAWALLTRNDPDTWDAAKYGGLTPIVPLNEEPELSQYDGPHIVYGFAEDTRPGPGRKTGSMTFAIYDQNFRRLTRAFNILTTAFEREDESARDINNFTTREGHLGIRFGYVAIGFAEGGTPEETEGGRQSALINIRYECYVDYEVITAV